MEEEQLPPPSSSIIKTTLDWILRGFLAWIFFKVVEWWVQEKTRNNIQSDDDDRRRRVFIPTEKSDMVLATIPENLRGDCRLESDDESSLLLMGPEGVDGGLYQIYIDYLCHGQIHLPGDSLLYARFKGFVQEYGIEAEGPLNEFFEAVETLGRDGGLCVDNLPRFGALGEKMGNQWLCDQVSQFLLLRGDASTGQFNSNPFMLVSSKFVSTCTNEAWRHVGESYGRIFTEKPSRPRTVELFQYMNTRNGDRFLCAMGYTEEELGHLKLKNEGVVGLALQKREEGSRPLYGIYDGTLQLHSYFGGGGDQVDWAVGHMDNHKFPITPASCFIYNAPKSGTMPVYFYTNPFTWKGFTTMTFSKVKGGWNATGEYHGYQFRKIVGYIYPVGSNPTTDEEEEDVGTLVPSSSSSAAEPDPSFEPKPQSWMNNLLAQKEHFDTEICLRKPVPNLYIPVHSVVLREAGPELLRNAEALDDFDLATVQMALAFLYTGNVPSSKEVEVGKVAEFAATFKLPDLGRLCECMLRKEWAHDEVTELLTLALETDNAILYYYAIQIMSRAGTHHPLRDKFVKSEVDKRVEMHRCQEIVAQTLFKGQTRLETVVLNTYVSEKLHAQMCTLEELSDTDLARLGEGYVAGKPLGFIHQTQVPDSFPLYRVSNPEKHDYILTIEKTGGEGERIGYIFPLPQDGTVPLLEFWKLENKKRRYHTEWDHSWNAGIPTEWRFCGVIGYIFPPPQVLITEEDEVQTENLAVTAEKAVVVEKNLVELHRYYNPALLNHFYSTNFNIFGEGKNGYVRQGIACLVFATPQEGTLPLFEYYLGGDKPDHYYTTDWPELGAGKGGYSYKGIACYVHPSPKDGTKPLHRYWNRGCLDLFLTTEWQEDGKDGYLYRGVTAHVY